MNVDEFRKTAVDIKIIDKVAEREQYSHDIGDLPAIMTKTLFNVLPDFVVQPKNIDEIIKVLSFANEHKIPVVPRGAASWGFGGVIPTRGGIVVDLSPFRNIIELLNTGFGDGAGVHRQERAQHGNRSRAGGLARERRLPAQRPDA